MAFAMRVAIHGAATPQRPTDLHHETLDLTDFSVMENTTTMPRTSTTSTNVATESCHHNHSITMNGVWQRPISVAITATTSSGSWTTVQGWLNLGGNLSGGDASLVGSEI